MKPLASLLMLTLALPALAASLTVKTGDLQVQAATATASDQGPTSGTVGEKQVAFERLSPGRYDVALKLKDGTQLNLIDASWHADAQADAPADAQPLSDDDRAAITDIVKLIKTFTNHNAIRSLTGNSERAVAVVECWRDTDFHARKGSEIVWRVEVWYFEFQAGGWAKVQQQNRIIDRRRFESVEAFEKHTKPMRWIGVHQGLKLEADKDSVIEVPQEKPAS